MDLITVKGIACENVFIPILNDQISKFFINFMQFLSKIKALYEVGRIFLEY